MKKKIVIWRKAAIKTADLPKTKMQCARKLLCSVGGNLQSVKKLLLEFERNACYAEISGAGDARRPAAPRKCIYTTINLQHAESHWAVLPMGGQETWHSQLQPAVCRSLRAERGEAVH